jgi:hypothetical protein
MLKWSDYIIFHGPEIWSLFISVEKSICMRSWFHVGFLRSFVWKPAGPKAANTSTASHNHEI